VEKICAARGFAVMVYEVTINGHVKRVELSRQNGGGWLCSLEGREVLLDVQVINPDVVSIVYEGKSFEARKDYSSAVHRIWIQGESYAAEVNDPRSFSGRKKRAGQEDGPRRLTAPMPGKIVRVLLEEASEVEAGQGIMVIEAMKMQNEIKSPKNGRIQKIQAQAGTSVNAGDLLAIVE
jgi:biotin carboxyl carrier protein